MTTEVYEKAAATRQRLTRGYLQMVRDQLINWFCMTWSTQSQFILGSHHLKVAVEVDIQ